MEQRVLRRTRFGAVFGVCGGIAEYFGWDPTAVRIGYVVGTIFSGGFGIVLYLILWFVMPGPR